MSPKEEYFDPVGARVQREKLVAEIKRLEKVEAALENPEKIGDATPIMRLDSPEFPATDYLDRRESAKKQVRSALSNLKQVLEMLDKKLAEHEGN